MFEQLYAKNVDNLAEINSQKHAIFQGKVMKEIENISRYVTRENIELVTKKPSKECPGPMTMTSLAKFARYLKKRIIGNVSQILPKMKLKASF